LFVPAGKATYSGSPSGFLAFSLQETVGIPGARLLSPGEHGLRGSEVEQWKVLSAVKIASGSGLNPSVGAPAYDAAKAAVIHYRRTQAATLAMKGIRVNCVAPGSIEFAGGFWERRKTEDPALYARVLSSMPAKRFGRPEEVAAVVLFLASPLANWVTAQIIGVNGEQGFAR
jgi:3-oxoacyl-[acyl-carrier protein] reductase